MIVILGKSFVFLKTGDPFEKQEKKFFLFKSKWDTNIVVVLDTELKDLFLRALVN